MGFDYQQRIATKIADKPIGKLLDNLRMETAFFTHSELHSPWALAMPSMHNCMMFHIVLSGEVSFECSGAQFNLISGDFVLFPKGSGHTLSDGQCNTITPLSDLPIKVITDRYETLLFGGDGAKITMACGALIFEHPLAIKLLGILPQHIVINSESPDSATLVNKIGDLLSNESQQLSVGADAFISRLAELLVIAAMRQHIDQLAEDKIGWLSAMEDERIGKAIKLIHAQPQKHWSLDELASAVGMSRTSFAGQFKKLVGNTPMDYLTEWRMSIAYSKLQLTQDSVLSIALDIGYQSEASFSRAFKKTIGKTPSEVRKVHKAITN